MNIKFYMNVLFFRNANNSMFIDKTVLIVGSGPSGADIAALVHKVANL